MQKSAQPVSLWSLYKMFLYVGLLSFGGGVTAWCHREVVLVRGWMTDDEFFSGYSLAQVLPGVNSTNMAVYVGQHVRGLIGSIVALGRAAHRAVLRRDRRRRRLSLPARRSWVPGCHGRHRDRGRSR